MCLTDEFPSYRTVQLPYVMNELTLTELDMGFSIPKILHASAPSVDHQGRDVHVEWFATAQVLFIPVP